MRAPDIAAIIETKDQLVKDLLPGNVKHGVLIPLKTTLELRDSHSCGQALITRAPTKSASMVIGYTPIQTRPQLPLESDSG